MTNSHVMRDRAAMMSSTMPSEKYSCPGSRSAVSNGKHDRRIASPGGGTAGAVGRPGPWRRGGGGNGGPGVAIAATRQRFDPVGAAGFIKGPAHGRDLDGQIAVFDGQPRPGRFEQGIFGDGGAGALQKQPEQGDRALPKHDRPPVAERSTFCIRVQPEGAEFVRRRHGCRRPRSEILQFRRRFTTREKHDAKVAASDSGNMSGPVDYTMSAKAVIRMPGEGKQVSLAGKPLVFLVTGQDTKHTSMFDWTLPAGFSDRHRVHRVREETFFVLEGECEWRIGGELVHAKPGTYVFIPPGVPHNIANASDKPARMIMTVSPPGHEQYFEELVKLVRKDGPPDAAAIATLRARFDPQQLSALKADSDLRPSGLPRPPARPRPAARFHVGSGSKADLTFD